MMKTNLASILSMVVVIGSLSAQSYTSYLTPTNAINIEVQPQFGICLMGGAGESDEAMTWFLERANGGDVVVLRASGSDGYNDYMYSDLGVTVNSVETIVFNSAAAANDPYVIDKVQNAEAIWLAGGDQGDYETYWKNTPIAEAINNLINVKQGPVGGISAGMAVLGQAYFPATLGSIDSEDALNNPFDVRMEFGWDDFIHAPFMENTITETHFNDPDRIRYGRVMAFLARLGFDEGIRPFALASNEFCAIAIDENGLARSFGEFPEFEDDQVYFLQGNCEGQAIPEILAVDQPLTWNIEGEAVKVYRVPGTSSGSNYFNLTTWTEGEGGFWENWYVIGGELFRDAGAAPADCLLSVRSASTIQLEVFPNPVSDVLTIRLDEPNWNYRIIDFYGRVLMSGKGLSNMRQVNVGHLSSGVYNVLVSTQSANKYVSFVVSH